MPALDSLDSGMWEGKYLQKIALPLTGMDNKEQGMWMHLIFCALFLEKYST